MNALNKAVGILSMVVGCCSLSLFSLSSGSDSDFGKVGGAILLVLGFFIWFIAWIRSPRKRKEAQPATQSSYSDGSQFKAKGDSSDSAQFDEDAVRKQLQKEIDEMTTKLDQERRKEGHPTNSEK